MSGVPSAPMVIPKFDNTLGALQLGGLMAMALWGVACVQAYNYYTRTNKDRMYLKIMIGLLWLLDTFDSALNGHFLYHYLVSNYLNPMAIYKPVWSLVIHVALTSMSNFIIRALFAIRVFRLSRSNLFITAWIMALSLGDLVVGITITIKAFQIETFPELDKIANILYLNFAFGTGSDLSLALALSCLLYRSRTGYHNTDSIVKTLFLYSVNTGMIVAIDASLGMIFYIVMPNNFIFLGFYLLLSKLYINAYLATLNAREALREKDERVSVRLSEFSSTQTPRFVVQTTTSEVTKKSSDTESGRLPSSIPTLFNKRESVYTV